ncbi:hypothetical protein [Nannocystis sp. SCPEA4]|uniref:hypothetical protein n=1 Tax=Nannocystis sp. SCPEA4 TaxID=2996787 RepID=UPI002270303C|nr:hypothetical protein [Nannocystis sp. SCPEA4]MCY1060159.1 hypothetical protein [Nannocystis sp. SCPEA4]
MLETVREAIARTRESLMERTWARLQTASPGDVARLFEPLADGERFVAAMAIGILRPELHAATARAFLAGRAAERPFVSSDFVQSSTAAQWIDVGADALTVDELTRFFEGAPWLLGPAIERRVAAGRIDDARALHRTISPHDKAVRATASAHIARAVAAQGDDPIRDLVAAHDEATQAPFIQGGGEEAEALTEVLKVMTQFLPPTHPEVVRAVARLVAFGNGWVKGMDWTLARAAEVCADAAGPVAPGWLDHARKIARNNCGIDEQAGAHIAAAEARLSLGPGDGAIPPPPASTFQHDSLEQLAARESLEHRAWGALWRGSDAMRAGDRADAEAAFRVALTPARRGLRPEDMALWIAALRAAGALAAAEQLLIDALAAASYDIDEALLAQVEALPGDAAARLWTRMHAAGLLWMPSRASRRRLAVDAIVAAIARANDPALIHKASAELRAMTFGVRYDDQLKRERRDAALDLLATVEGEPGGDLPTRLARALVRGRQAETKRLSAELSPESRRAFAALSSQQRTRRPRGVDVAARTYDGEDVEVWRHRVALAHLAEGEVDAAIDLCRAMGDCRVTGHGPGPLAAAIALHLDAAHAWSSRRATQLLDVLAGVSVIPQDLPDPLLTVLPRAWQHLERPRNPAPYRDKFGRFVSDAACVDLALARALERAGDRQGAAREFTQALARVVAPFVYIGPRVFLETLRACPQLPGWTELWRRSFALYRTGVHAADAAHGVRGQARALIAAERPLFHESVRERWPDEVQSALRESACELIARGADDEDALRWLLSTANRADEAQTAAVAAACVAVRRDHSEAREFAALAGLPGLV